MFQLFHSTLLESDRAARGRSLFFSDRTAPRRRRLSRRAVSGRSLFAKKKEKNSKRGKTFSFFKDCFSFFHSTLLEGDRTPRGRSLLQKEKQFYRSWDK
jgi:hypothetical protein